MHKILGILVGVSLFLLISWFGLRLYQVMSLPGLKLKDNVYHVINCEQPRDEHARMACPYLYCNKTLLESGEIPENAGISRNSGDPATTGNTLIEGLIRYTTKEGLPVRQRFQCHMQGDVVTHYKILAIE